MSPDPVKSVTPADGLAPERRRDASTPDAAPAASGVRRAVIRVLRSEDATRKATAPIGLLILSIIFTLTSPYFLTEVNVNGMLADSVIPICLTLSAIFVLSLGGIDLSLAAVVSLGTVVAAALEANGLPLVLALSGSLAVGLVVGLTNGLIIGRARIPAFIVTLATMSIVAGIGLGLSQGQVHQIGAGSDFLSTLGTKSVGIFRYDFIVVIAVACVMHVILFHTRSGTHLLAIGDSEEAAQAMGIRQGRIKLFGYGLAGLLAGLGSIMLATYIGSSEPAQNTDYLLNAIAAVVLGGVSLFGGRANIWAPVVGAILLTVLRDGLVLIGFSPFYTPVAIGVVVLGAAILMREGR